MSHCVVRHTQYTKNSITNYPRLQDEAPDQTLSVWSAVYRKSVFESNGLGPQGAYSGLYCFTLMCFPNAQGMSPDEGHRGFLRVLRLSPDLALFAIKIVWPAWLSLLCADLKSPRADQTNSRLFLFGSKSPAGQWQSAFILCCELIHFTTGCVWIPLEVCLYVAGCTA